MKRLFVFICMCMAITTSHAEVVVSFDAPKGLVPITTDTKLWIKCFNCQAEKEWLKDRFTQHGYRVVDDSTDADLRIVFAAAVSVPKDGAAPFVSPDDIAGRQLPPIPPALKEGINKEQHNGAPLGALDLDAGSIREGAKLTGSVGGAIGIAAGVSLLTSWIQKSAADAARTPGVVRMSVRIEGKQHRQSINLLAASDTPESPEVLLNSSFAAALQALIKGLSVGVK